VCLSNPWWAEKKDIFFSVNTRQRKQFSNPSLIQRRLRGKNVWIVLRYGSLDFDERLDRSFLPFDNFRL
jgi:hypothetical protein